MKSTFSLALIWNCTVVLLISTKGITAAKIMHLQQQQQGRSEISSEVLKCKTGDHWKEDCNSCICHMGEQKCTKKGCHEFPNSKEEEEVSTEDLDRILDFEDESTEKVLKCKTGDHWKEDCNSCICHMGEQRCTKKECHGFPNSKEEEVSTEDFSRILDFEDESTEKDLLPACKIGTVWIEDCNICICEEDGTLTCSTEICDPQCTDGEFIFDGCNKCMCVSGALFCTLRDCSNVLHSEYDNYECYTKSEDKIPYDAFAMKYPEYNEDYA